MENFTVKLLELSLIYGILILGVYISYKVLAIPDLTVDGSFPLGASVSALCLIKGINPMVSLILALVAGALAGLLTGILHVKLKIVSLLSGILMMIALYSINLRIMGKSNIPLFNTNRIFDSKLRPLFIIIFIYIIAKITLDILLKTRVGYMLKATGDNQQVVTALGVDLGIVKIVGLMLSNSLVALSGAVLAQYQGFADVGMGNGIIIIGLASVILGESIFSKVKFIKGTTAVVLGGIVYRFFIAFALNLGLPPSDLKLITAVIVVIALTLRNQDITKKVLKGGGVYAFFK